MGTFTEEILHGKRHFLFSLTTLHMGQHETDRQPKVTHTN